ncbi:hypothetical protein BDZ85DRAFT_261090 [Elsinoe ampelina]|uniref:VOC domain-containing protein n=1 Tax=Elsinoe ampelina TaxID=302913 RepID=A0A6A6GFW6_9PEZI|nr:hypothetical protein BDZ85DRAFT_261090 [Elsinoe ampelina]
MPVAHIGLSVQNIAASYSFFAAALQPLGYRYIGSRDDQLGFGVQEADFFLSPVKGPNKPAPVHIAFAATSRAAVRNFYACSLNAGGSPAGPPGYRGQDLEVFNTAVLDLDGNTIEVVHHEVSPPNFGPPPSQAGVEAVEPQGDDRGLSTPQLEIPQYVPAYYAPPQSVPPPSAFNTTRSTRPPASAVSDESERSERPSRSKGNVARSALRSVSCAPNVDNPSKAFIGTLIGAAAGAAAIYAMVSSERDSSRKEKEFNRTMSRTHSQTSKSRARYDGADRFDRQSMGRISRAHTSGNIHDVHAYVKPPIRSVTFDGNLRQLPMLAPGEMSTSPRHDSAVSVGSRKSTRSRRDSKYIEPGLTFRDSFRPDRAIEWIPEGVEPASGRRSSAPTRESSHHRHRSHRSERRHSEYPAEKGTSRISAAEVPLPTSIVDSRASIRDRGLYGKSSKHSKRDKYTPVTFDMIKSSFGGSKKDNDNYADTVLPEDSISCVSSHRSRSRMPTDYERTKPDRRVSEREHDGRGDRDRKDRGRRSAASLPIRERTDERRWRRAGAASYA